MTKNIENKPFKKTNAQDDRLLGERHEYQSEKKRSFKSIAKSIGFSKEDIEKLKNIYSGKKTKIANKKFR